VTRARAARALRGLAVAVLLAGLGGCASSAAHSRPGTTTTVILTRHGDTDPGSGVLSATGRERAQALVAGPVTVDKRRYGP